jgi:hypothetical protein
MSDTLDGGMEFRVLLLINSGCEGNVVNFQLYHQTGWQIIAALIVHSLVQIEKLILIVT